MGKLTSTEIDQYFATHVPYRLGILLAHYRMTRKEWKGDPAILNACFVAALVTARMFLNVLGIGKDKNGLVCFDPFPTDVCVDDLGGTPIDPATLQPEDQRLFLDFLKMADQAAAHFTTPIAHDWTKTHEVILRIHKHLKVNLYERTGRRIEKI